MQIDFSRVLVGYNGQPLADGETPISLGLIACNAVTAPIPGETLTGVQKVERVELARRIHRGMAGKATIAVTVEEVALLKQTINAAYPTPILVAAAWELLDPP